LTPVETHVFASLSYNLPIFVGTTDGGSWKVALGKISHIDPMRPASTASVRETLAAMNERCLMIISKTGEPNPKICYQPTASVIQPPSRNSQIHAQSSAGELASACWVRA